MIADRVLVVDDHPVNRMLPMVLLRQKGWSCDEASGGEEALAKLASGHFSIVLLDVSMPGMSGDDVCRRIRADKKLKGLRVIAYTAHAMNEERAQMVAAGFDDLLTKPITKESLFAALGAPEPPEA